MSILYPLERLVYEPTIESPIFEVFEFQCGNEWVLNEKEDCIVFVLAGAITFNLRNKNGLCLKQNEFFLVTFDSGFNAEWLAEGKAMIVRMQKHINFGQFFSTDPLIKQFQNLKPDHSVLPIRKEVHNFITSLTHLEDEGFTFTTFSELKYRELFLLFWGYYTKQEMYEFFYYHFTEDLNFSDFIYRNYKESKNVNELAEKSNYSISGFSKRFKKVFGTSPYRWLQQKRSEQLLSELLNSEKTFKELCDDYNFTSPSHLNEFCKLYYGNTPGTIRKSKNVFSNKLNH